MACSPCLGERVLKVFVEILAGRRQASARAVCAELSPVFRTGEPETVMAEHERDIRWAPLAATNFIRDFDPHISDVDIINAKLAYVCDHEEDGEARSPVEKDKIPELKDGEGDVLRSVALESLH